MDEVTKKFLFNMVEQGFSFNKKLTNGTLEYDGLRLTMKYLDGNNWSSNINRACCYKTFCSILDKIIK